MFYCAGEEADDAPRVAVAAEEAREPRTVIDHPLRPTDPYPKPSVAAVPPDADIRS